MMVDSSPTLCYSQSLEELDESLGVIQLQLATSIASVNLGRRQFRVRGVRNADVLRGVLRL